MSDSCNPMDCSLSGSSVNGILQGRILEWVAISFSRGSSWPRNWTRVSCIAGRFFTDWAEGSHLSVLSFNFWWFILNKCGKGKWPEVLLHSIYQVNAFLQYFKQKKHLLLKMTLWYFYLWDLNTYMKCLYILPE